MSEGIEVNKNKNEFIHVPNAFSPRPTLLADTLIKQAGSWQRQLSQNNPDFS